MELVAPAVVGTAGNEQLARALRGQMSPHGGGADDAGAGFHRGGDEHAHDEHAPSDEHAHDEHAHDEHAHDEHAPTRRRRASHMSGLNHQTSVAANAAKAKTAANVALMRAKVMSSSCGARRAACLTSSSLQGTK